MIWLAAPTPDPTLGTTTPVADVLHWAMLDGLITFGALILAAVQVVVVLRTLASVTVGRKQQAELLRKQELAFARQERILAALGLADDADPQNTPPAAPRSTGPGGGDEPGITGPPRGADPAESL